MTNVTMNEDQAKRVLQVAPKDSPYYQEAQKILFAKGYIPSPMKLEDDAPPCPPGT